MGREIAEYGEVLTFAGYPEFEAAADRAAGKIKEGYMEMGYILKLARDTDILAGSGYRGHEEFGAERYGLDKGTVSRYIRIVERFSVGGNSHVLREHYRNMGFSKLSIMLHMPDAVSEQLMESLSKAEVAAVREEVEAEERISEIELAIERGQETGDPEPEGTTLDRTMLRLGKEQQELYRKLWNVFYSGAGARAGDTLAPQGNAVYMVRIPGTGRMMLAISDRDASVTNIRSRETERYSREELIRAAEGICRTDCGTAEESFRKVYGEEMTASPKGHGEPGGQEKDREAGKKKRRDTKVIKARPEGSKVQAALPEPGEEQLPGQMELGDYECVVPEVSFEEVTGSSREEEGERQEAEEPGQAFDGKETGLPWEELERQRNRLDSFFCIFGGRDIREVPEKDLKEAYQEAIALAAGLERLLLAAGRRDNE